MGTSHFNTNISKYFFNQNACEFHNLRQETKLTKSLKNNFVKINLGSQEMLNIIHY